MGKLDKAYMPKVLPTEILMSGTLKTRRELALHVDRYGFALPFVNSKVVLDVACGSGYG